jgi:hypothetical protein
MATLLAACAGNSVSSPAAGGASTVPTTFTNSLVGPSQPATAAHHPAWMKFAKEGPKGIVYVAPVDASVVAFARRNRSGAGPLCSIPIVGEVFGLGVDPSGNLWAAIEASGNVSSVQEFGPNCGAAGATLSDPGFASDVTFDRNGTAYVSDYDTTGSQPGAIEVYAKGATNPTGVLTDPSMAQALNVATDRNGDVFATIVEPNNAHGVIEFPSGTMPGTVLGVTGFTEGVSMILDRANNLLVDDIGHPSQLDVYPPPYSGAPARTIPLTEQSESCVLGQHEERIFCGDDLEDTVDVYAYPSGTYEYSYRGGITTTIIAVATYPL